MSDTHEGEPRGPQPARAGRSGLEPRSFQIRRILGSGGFGTVVLACMRGGDDFERMVALKMLKARERLPEELVLRLRDEARMLGLVRHRAVVHSGGPVTLINPTGVKGRRRPIQAIIMDYIEGADLSDVLEFYRCVPVVAALEIGAEVAGALRAGWEAVKPDGEPLYLLHRDIKPSNLKLTASGEIFVLDFGIARAQFDGREAVTQRVLLATLEYAAPERLLGENGPAADVYSLASVLYEMLAGERLSDTKGMDSHGDRLAHALHELRAAGTPPQVCSLVIRCLAGDPASRPTARDLELELDRLAHLFPGPTLRSWAREVVPALLPLPESERDWNTLVEWTGLRRRAGGRGSIDDPGTHAPTTPPPAARASTLDVVVPVAPSEVPRRWTEDPRRVTLVLIAGAVALAALLAALT